MATEHLTRTELGRALGLEAGDVALPVSARSLTRREMLARDWREIRWIVPAYLLLILAAGATVALADTIPDRVRWLPLGFAAGAIALGIFAWLRLRRSRSYEDPMIAVEVADDAVTLRSGGDTVVKAYEALNVVRVVTRAPRKSLYFDGVVLDTELGRIVLGDPDFADGNVAAGAILRRFEALGLTVGPRA
ncbi:hypothetical protein [Sphingosinicella sp.]|uniref:hypothetical protein n=1 Tax=Sphingosinicella sp. TaxID=1917971 RepID=UPI004037FEB5